MKIAILLIVCGLAIRLSYYVGIECGKSDVYDSLKVARQDSIKVWRERFKNE